MRSIKTYEGFLDFFKRKPKSTEPVYMDDIKECGYDFLHDNRIATYVDGRTPGGIGHDFDDIFGIKRVGRAQMGYVTNDYEEQLSGETPRNIRGNMMIIQFRYTLLSEDKNAYSGVSGIQMRHQEGDKAISREEMSEMLKDFSGKLETLDCKTSFYLAWGYDEGRTDDKEYKNIDKVMDVIYKVDRTPLVTMKITAPSNIIVD
jgi:hypothetical protein